jgi:hypothetical protein
VTEPPVHIVKDAGWVPEQKFLPADEKCIIIFKSYLIIFLSEIFWFIHIVTKYQLKVHVKIIFYIIQKNNYKSEKKK